MCAKIQTMTLYLLSGSKESDLAFAAVAGKVNIEVKINPDGSTMESLARHEGITRLPALILHGVAYMGLEAIEKCVVSEARAGIEPAQ